MCGRYTLAKLERVLRQFPSITTPLPSNLSPRFNVAPTQPVLAIANDDPGRVGLFHWGLIPAWAKDPSVGGRMINARGETLADRPAFRTAVRRRRCLIPADGFYEWRRNPDGRTKTPTYFRLRSGEPFAFAGLWDVWRGPDGSEIPSCTIVTTSPNALVEPVHDRMPVILPAEHYGWWLAGEEQRPEDVAPLLKPYPPAAMEAHAVSTRVNTPRNDDARLVDPVAAETLF